MSPKHVNGNRMTPKYIKGEDKGGRRQMVGEEREAPNKGKCFVKRIKNKTFCFIVFVEFKASRCIGFIFLRMPTFQL